MPLLRLGDNDELSFSHRPPRFGGVTFVCINALSGDQSMWHDTIGAPVTEAGHGLVTYNLRGQAGSACSAAQISADMIIEDLCALMDHLKPQKPVYMGLSIGGLFAMRAHLAGRTAHAFVLLNTLRRLDVRLEWINAAVAKLAEVGGLDLLRDIYGPLLFNVDWQEANRDQFLKNHTYTPLPAGDGAYQLLEAGAGADWGVPYEDIEPPVLNITGLQDRVFFNPDHVDGLIKRLPNATRLDFADAGHMIPLERPEKLAAALLDFAEKL